MLQKFNSLYSEQRNRLSVSQYPYISTSPKPTRCPPPVGGGKIFYPGKFGNLLPPHAPAHRNVLNVVVIRIEAGRVNGQLISGSQPSGSHLRNIAAGIGHYLHMMRLSHVDGDRAGFITRG